MTSAAPSKWGDLAVRTFSALVLAPVVIADIWLGNAAFLIFAALLGVLIAHEWSSIVFPRNQIQYALHFLAAISGALASYFSGVWEACGVIFCVALVSGLMARFGDAAKSVWSYLGIFYTGLPVVALIQLRNDSDYGFSSILWIFLIVWSADVLAYFAGRIIGGPKLAPRISPKKTWAGLFGAIVGSALASILFARYMNLSGVAALALLAAALAVVEQAGDLFESAMKRYYGVKDSGHLIPGHGGVIDRVDGLIAVVVVAAIIGVFRQQGLGAAHGLLLW
jgi:phosphatidate cytidylyltransferase